MFYSVCLTKEHLRQQEYVLSNIPGHFTAFTSWYFESWFPTVRPSFCCSCRWIRSRSPLNFTSRLILVGMTEPVYFIWCQYPGISSQIIRRYLIHHTRCRRVRGLVAFLELEFRVDIQDLFASNGCSWLKFIELTSDFAFLTFAICFKFFFFFFFLHTSQCVVLSRHLQSKEIPYSTSVLKCQLSNGDFSTPPNRGSTISRYSSNIKLFRQRLIIEF